MATTTASVGSGRRKRKSIVSSEGSSQHKETKKKKKQVEEQSTPASNRSQKECITSPKDIISEVNFKTKPKQVLSAVEPATHDEAGPSGLQQMISSQEDPPSLREEEQDEDIEYRSRLQQLSNYKDYGIKTKKNKSFLCPKCGRGFTSKKRLIQGHYDEETQTCKYELEAEKKRLCPACGKYVSNLQHHYNEETKSCKKSKPTEKINEEELYATLTEDVTISKRNSVWRFILKHFKILKCQNENCNHRANSVSAMIYHAERCGKVAEKFSCPVCNKSYTSKQGLDYHTGTQHRSQSPEQSSDPPQAELTMSKRKAAVQAAAHIAKVSTDASSKDTSQTDKQSDVIEDNISEMEWATIRNAFKSGQEVKCPSPHCSLMFKSISGLRYHVSRCKENRTLTCALCKKQLTSWQRFQNHMMKIHRIGEEDSLDYKCTEAGNSDDDDDDDDGEEKQKTQLQAQTKKTSYRTINSLQTSYQQHLKKLVEELMSCEELFTDWQPSLKSWIRCNPRECTQFAPVAKHSMRYCFANSKHGTSPVSQLTLFGAALEDERYGVSSGVIFNVGGPVWSMAWAPFKDESPSNVQYIAMAAYRTLEETYRMDIPLQHNGLIQLWSATLSDQPQLPRLSLGIAHNYGCIRSMKWCPSGCVAKLTPTIDNAETLSRLGLLALACTDAVVRILSIPYPDILLERLDPIKQHDDHDDHDDDDHDDDVYNVFVMPKSICCLLSPSNITNQSDFSTLYGQCLDVEWLPRQPHNKIAACFSNGTVVIWDLLSTSSLLRGSHDHCDVVFYPQEHISAHFGNVCRTISWCADDPDYLVTGGYDRRLCLWDLKYPDEPVDKWDRGWCLDSKWPLLSPGVFCLEDCVTPSRSDSLVRNLYFHEFQTGKPASIIRSTTPQISFSYCHWKSNVAFGTIDGNVSFTHLPPFIYFFRRPKNKKSNSQVLCFCARLSADEEGETMSNSSNDIPSSSTDNKHLTFYNFPQEKEHQLEYKPDIDPVTAITKVAWNPHHQYCDWLLVATNTGLVRLLKLSS